MQQDKHIPNPVLLIVSLDDAGYLYISKPVADILFGDMYSNTWYAKLYYDNFENPISITFCHYKDSDTFDIQREGDLYFIQATRIFNAVKAVKNKYSIRPVIFGLEITSYTNEIYNFRLIEMGTGSKGNIIVRKKRNNVKYNTDKTFNIFEKTDRSKCGTRNYKLGRKTIKNIFLKSDDFDDMCNLNRFVFFN